MTRMRRKYKNEKLFTQKNHVPAGSVSVHLSSVHADVGKHLAGRE